MSEPSLSNEQLQKLLVAAKTVAVVGISEKPERSSYSVSQYLEQYYQVVPVNPMISSWNGKTCYPSLAAVPADIKIDIVDIFRRSELVLPVVEEAIARGGVSLIWMQQEVVHAEAANLARQAGIEVVMDACLAVVHASLVKGAFSK